jgi:hypothetical protein
MNDLEHDLTRQVRAKLRRWGVDAIDLFEMAEAKNGPRVVVLALLEYLTWIMAGTGIPKQVFMSNVAKTFDKTIELKKQAESKND